jgi:hypothetical protein
MTKFWTWTVELRSSVLENYSLDYCVTHRLWCSFVEKSNLWGGAKRTHVFQIPLPISKNAFFYYPFQKHAFLLLPISKTSVPFTTHFENIWSFCYQFQKHALFATHFKNMHSFCATLYLQETYSPTGMRSLMKRKKIMSTLERTVLSTGYCLKWTSSTCTTSALGKSWQCILYFILVFVA